MMLYRNILIPALFLGSLLSCCNAGRENAGRQDVMAEPEFDETIPGSFSTQKSLFFDSSWRDSFLTLYPRFELFRENIEQFYSNRKYAYAWFDEHGITEQAHHLYDRVLHLKKEGLPDSTLYQPALMMLMDSIANGDNTSITDLMLTAQYFYYSSRIFEGLGEDKSRSIDWFLPRKKVSHVALLDSLLNSEHKTFFAEPVFRQYNLLKKELHSYHTTGLDTVSRLIILDKNNYRAGDASAIIPVVKRRLFKLGDMDRADSTPVFDQFLHQAVMRFQKRHGLTQDGIAGPSFFAELNIPGSERVKQIMLNMERYRWIPEKMEGDYLVVNIPEFRLHSFTDDSLNWSMNVVVGQELHKTVVFHGHISYLVFSPYWNIPPGILKRDILPAMRRDEKYLVRNNMEVTGYNGNTPRIRQKPGASNPMGKVKFMFPNSYNIYLHDSPSKSLFEKEQRTFSSGCIRVADAEKLARYLLQSEYGWTEEKINHAMNAKKETYINLAHKMPVFIVYFTTWVDSDGNLNFRKDIYERDSKLNELLFSVSE